ncbi:nucleoside deaminase [Lysinibacter sp. HNR]|uniref:nucleoside deaminase n=1 Tax=Lysinibacter sp. HNR TaxID=3031408 RepID=UPI002435A08C|nr:nucleoside deaminase [Lysinibacter sp. HNR]WGD38569.1 nucleoside deaminase [Lysinibacter sp. HNR]
MLEALEEAKRALVTGDVPVGALIFDVNGVLIGSGRNMRQGTYDPTAHAEVVAIKQAAQHVQDRVLEGCTLVVTLEPCVMCAGAIATARIPTVVFGAWDEKAGAAGSVYDVLRDRRLPHRSEVIAGVEEDASAALLREFFAGQR